MGGRKSHENTDTRTKFDAFSIVNATRMYSKEASAAAAGYKTGMVVYSRQKKYGSGLSPDRFYLITKVNAKSIYVVPVDYEYSEEHKGQEERIWKTYSVRDPAPDAKPFKVPYNCYETDDFDRREFGYGDKKYRLSLNRGGLWTLGNNRELRFGVLHPIYGYAD